MSLVYPHLPFVTFTSGRDPHRVPVGSTYRARGQREPQDGVLEGWKHMPARNEGSRNEDTTAGAGMRTKGEWEDGGKKGVPFLHFRLV